jgi:hypothetical protein
MKAHYFAKDLKTSNFLCGPNALYPVVVKFVSCRSPYPFYLLTVGVEFVYFHLIPLRHTPQSVGLL